MSLQTQRSSGGVQTVRVLCDLCGAKGKPLSVGDSDAIHLRMRDATEQARTLGWIEVGVGPHTPIRSSVKEICPRCVKALRAAIAPAVEARPS